jgi:hypothetical protein
MPIDAETRLRLTQAGLTPADFSWFDGFNWDDRAIPILRADQLADFQRREAVLNKAVAELSFAERGESVEGRLAAAIGAVVANFRDAEDDED